MQQQATVPYTTETVDISTLGDGHGNNGVNSGDIIPPTPNTDFPNGQNWNTNGQAIWNNNCNVPSVTPTATPTAIPTVAPTATPTVTVPTATPTVTVTTPTPTIDPCANNACPETTTSVTPTVTVTDTPNPTDTPTSAPSNNSGGDNNSGSNNASSNNSSASNPPVQAVLSANTMAETGTFTTTIMNSMLIFGMMVLGAGFMSYAKEKKA
ncbi:MAG: hypothetical protein ACREGI_00825 [Candidatus Levyibacteriota bacterium]